EVRRYSERHLAGATAYVHRQPPAFDHANDQLRNLRGDCGPVDPVVLRRPYGSGHQGLLTASSESQIIAMRPCRMLRSRASARKASKYACSRGSAEARSTFLARSASFRSAG